jgi:hypothetical protein
VFRVLKLRKNYAPSQQIYGCGARNYCCCHADPCVHIPQRTFYAVYAFLSSSLMMIFVRRRLKKFKVPKKTENKGEEITSEPVGNSENNSSEITSHVTDRQD